MLLSTPGNNPGEEKISVIVVEDDHDDMKRLATILQGSGCFSIHQIHSYRDIDLAEEIKRLKPDVISLDLDMEGEIHAQPIVRALRRIDPTLAIGAVTRHITFSHYLEDIDFFLVKDWSKLDQCVMTFKMGGLRRLLSWLTHWLDEQVEQGADALLVGKSACSEAPSFASKIALLIKSEDWPFESSAFDRLIREVYQLPRRSNDANLQERLRNLCNTAAELRQQVTRLGVRHDLLAKGLEEEKELLEVPSEVEERRWERYTDVLLPEECELHKEATLSIQLRFAGEAETVETSSSLEREVEILVLISGKGFDIPERAKVMVVPYDRDSQKVEFTLIPRRLGGQAISIEFFKTAARIGYVIATTFVGEKKRYDLKDRLHQSARALRLRKSG